MISKLLLYQFFPGLTLFWPSTAGLFEQEALLKLKVGISMFLFTYLATTLLAFPVSITFRIRKFFKVQRTYSSVNIFGTKNLYLVGLLAVAISPFYCFGYLYCITFLYIIIDNDILQRALQSVTKNGKNAWAYNQVIVLYLSLFTGKSLIWVALLLLIILYMYAIIAFQALRDPFVQADNMYCDDLSECFVSVLRFGLIDSFLVSRDAVAAPPPKKKQKNNNNNNNNNNKQTYTIMTELKSC